MSEQETMEVETNPVADFIDAVAAQNFNRAKEHFDSLLGDRVNTALDQEKMVVADQIFNDVDLEVDDEIEVEDEVEEVEVEEEEVEETDFEDSPDDEDDEPVAPV